MLTGLVVSSGYNASAIRASHVHITGERQGVSTEVGTGISGVCGQGKACCCVVFATGPASAAAIFGMAFGSCTREYKEFLGESSRVTTCIDGPQFSASQYRLLWLAMASGMLLVRLRAILLLMTQ